MTQQEVSLAKLIHRQENNNNFTWEPQDLHLREQQDLHLREQQGLYLRGKQDWYLREQKDLYPKLLSLYICADFSSVGNLYAKQLNQLKDLVTRQIKKWNSVMKYKYNSVMK